MGHELVVRYTDSTWMLSIESDNGMPVEVAHDLPMPRLLGRLAMVQLHIGGEVRFVWGHTEMDPVIFRTIPVDVIETIVDRAACGEWPIPTTEEEFAAWIQDEIQIQKGVVADIDRGDLLEDRDVRCAYIERLRLLLGAMLPFVVPAKLPWEYPELSIWTAESGDDPETMRSIVAARRFPALAEYLLEEEFKSLHVVTGSTDLWIELGDTQTL